jgi:hypothetical protein
LRFGGNRGEDFAFPSSDRSGVALIGALQWLLRGQPQARKQRANRGERQAHFKAREQQFLDDLPGPQSKVKAVLIGALSIDPSKYLSLLGAGEFSRSSRPFGRAQRLQPAATSARRRFAFVSPRSIHAERRGHGRRVFSLIHPLNRQNAHFFKRVVGQSATVSFHQPLNTMRPHSSPNRPLNY